MTGPPQPLFVLDANVFITAHRSYYALNLCPGFWDCLIHFFHEGRLMSIDRIRDELIDHDDPLSEWVKRAPTELFATSLEDAVTDSYRDVMAWVYANDQFSPQAKNDFSRGADGWLVAYAKVHNATLVTLETYHQGARRRVPLPNVCKQFSVLRMDTFKMLSELGVRFDWHPSG